MSVVRCFGSGTLLDPRVRSAANEWREPWDRFARGANGVSLCGVLATREVADRRPCAHVLWIPTELFEPEGVVWPLEDVDTAIALEGLVTCEDQPRFVEARRHGGNRTRSISPQLECSAETYGGHVDGSAPRTGASTRVIQGAAVRMGKADSTLGTSVHGSSRCVVDPEAWSGHRNIVGFPTGQGQRSRPEPAEVPTISATP